jgi:hypothetical protein
MRACIRARMREQRILNCLPPSFFTPCAAGPCQQQSFQGTDDSAMISCVALCFVACVLPARGYKRSMHLLCRFTYFFATMFVVEDALCSPFSSHWNLSADVSLRLRRFWLLHPAICLPGNAHNAPGIGYIPADCPPRAQGRLAAR